MKDKKGSIIASIYLILNFIIYLIMCLIAIYIIWGYIESLFFRIILTICVIIGNLYFEERILSILVNGFISLIIKSIIKILKK